MPRVCELSKTSKTRVWLILLIAAKVLQLFFSKEFFYNSYDPTIWIDQASSFFHVTLYMLSHHGTGERLSYKIAMNLRVYILLKFRGFQLTLS